MTKTEIQLKERCLILEKVLIALSPVYFDQDTNENQRRLIETTIGAAIFYLPQGAKYWTGKISKSALDSIMNDPKITLTKEHEFPRKIAAKELINHFKAVNMNISLHDLYEQKYGRYNLVTPSENKKVSAFQKDGVFDNIELAYKNAGIELLQISVEELARFKRRKL